MEVQCNQPCEEYIYCIHCGFPIDQDEPYFVYVEKDIEGHIVYCCDDCT
ncbi:hypothetical protein ABES02_18900 [Neobacillus pocheonensis]